MTFRWKVNRLECGEKALSPVPRPSLPGGATAGDGWEEKEDGGGGKGCESRKVFLKVSSSSSCAQWRSAQTHLAHTWNRGMLADLQVSSGVVVTVLCPYRIS